MISLPELVALWRKTRVSSPGLIRLLYKSCLRIARCLYGRARANRQTPDAYVCIDTSATCTYTEGYVGCCVPNQRCNVVKTTCLDYDAVADGECDRPNDFSTLCWYVNAQLCGHSAVSIGTEMTNLAISNVSTRGGCYTWLFSTSAEDSDDDELSTYSFLDCSARRGTGTLLDYDPAWARTHIPSTTTTEESSTEETETQTETATGTETNDPTETESNPPEETEGGGGGGGSSTNVGAIAGGTVGGVAALGLVGAAAFLLIRRRKKDGDASPGPQDPSQQMSQQNPNSPPPMTQTPSSAGPVYPSGVPSSGYGAYSPQQGYDPHMSTYSQQGFPPHQQGYQPFPPQGQFPGQQPMHPQQQAYGYQPSSTTGSPPPHTSPSPSHSPGVGGVGYPPHQNQPQQPQQPASELQTINPVGMESNRAELG